ncbi:DUF1697 domain-containing protein [Novosphingobium sp.]|uniref:DUF1697 domain-containing protein n=1 Tax=Novosphingobium sp. TaxID=1874826 RepID=UPI00286C49B5|nr:DUF1697 domain-containing protein [Novosphingobium sp.]
MTGWVALLRAVNVGGNNKIPMADLTALATRLGLEQARTYIASGNLIFASKLGENVLRAVLEQAIAAEWGKPIGVLVRSAEELADVTARCPWPDRPGNRVVAVFSDAALSLDGVRHQADEVLALGQREIFIDYGGGMADSRLVVPAAKAGTARNMNSVRKLAELAGALA